MQLMAPPPRTWLKSIAHPGIVCGSANVNRFRAREDGFALEEPFSSKTKEDEHACFELSIAAPAALVGCRVARMRHCRIGPRREGRRDVLVRHIVSAGAFP